MRTKGGRVWVGGLIRTNTINDLHAGIMTLKTATFDRRLFDTDMSVGSSQAGGDPSAAQPSGKPYKKNTIHDLIGLLKRFYRWMAESNFSEIDPKKIRAIQIPGQDPMTKTVDMIITPDEVEAIIRACESPRDRALFGMLWDGGFRAVEVGTLTWEQIRFVECGAVVNVDAKTEFPRYVRLLCSSANLTQWHDSYPCAISDNALVFLTRQRRSVTYDVLAVELGKPVKKAGISK